MTMPLMPVTVAWETTDGWPLNRVGTGSDRYRLQDGYAYMLQVFSRSDAVSGISIWVNGKQQNLVRCPPHGTAAVPSLAVPTGQDVLVQPALNTIGPAGQRLEIRVIPFPLDET